MPRSPVPALEDLPETFPVLWASEILGIGLNVTYAMVRDGQYPIRVLDAGSGCRSRYRCTKADLMAYLGYRVKPVSAS
jgi:hypothetical protein